MNQNTLNQIIANLDNMADELRDYPEDGHRLEGVLFALDKVKNMPEGYDLKDVMTDINQALKGLDWQHPSAVEFSFGVQDALLTINRVMSAADMQEVA